MVIKYCFSCSNEHSEAVPFLGIFVSNFRHCFFAVHLSMSFSISLLHSLCSSIACCPASPVTFKHLLHVVQPFLLTVQPLLLIVQPFHAHCPASPSHYPALSCSLSSPARRAHSAAPCNSQLCSFPNLFCSLQSLFCSTSRPILLSVKRRGIILQYT